MEVIMIFETKDILDILEGTILNNYSICGIKEIRASHNEREEIVVKATLQLNTREE